MSTAVVDGYDCWSVEGQCSRPNERRTLIYRYYLCLFCQTSDRVDTKTLNLDDRWNKTWEFTSKVHLTQAAPWLPTSLRGSNCNAGKMAQTWSYLISSCFVDSSVLFDEMYAGFILRNIRDIFLQVRASYYHIHTFLPYYSMYKMYSPALILAIHAFWGS